MNRRTFLGNLLTLAGTAIIKPPPLIFDLAANSTTYCLEESGLYTIFASHYLKLSQAHFNMPSPWARLVIDRNCPKDKIYVVRGGI